MIPTELERLVKESIAKGNQPYFVNCTCGTTVFGAFDPINPIADICEKYNLWLHIDVIHSSNSNQNLLFKNLIIILLKKTSYIMKILKLYKT